MEREVNAMGENGAKEHEQSGGQEIVKAAVEHVASLTSKEVLGVVSVEASDDGWLVGVEVLEAQHVPSSSDLLAIYQAEIDTEGDLMSYRRLRRYKRNQVGDFDDGGF